MNLDCIIYLFFQFRKRNNCMTSNFKVKKIEKYIF